MAEKSQTEGYFDLIRKHGEGRSVLDIPDAELVERAVRNAGHARRSAPRWSQVQHAFALGSTYSAQLCRRFGFDPDEVCGVEGESTND